jgi:hypothetical protein
VLPEVITTRQPARYGWLRDIENLPPVPPLLFDALRARHLSFRANRLLA